MAPQSNIMKFLPTLVTFISKQPFDLLQNGTLCEKSLKITSVYKTHPLRCEDLGKKESYTKVFRITDKHIFYGTKEHVYIWVLLYNVERKQFM